MNINLLLKIADEFGTPTYVYDSEKIKSQYLRLKNAGAYCFSMSSNYNLRYKPAEFMLINDTYKLIRERERFENLLINQIDIFN